MERRLIPINAWIALHRGEGGWPAKLAEQGFRIHRFEAPVQTDAGRVVVDGVSVADDLRAVIPTECKSGQSIENDQAERYAAMTAGNVARFVGLPFDSSSAELSPMYACLEESKTGVVVDLDRLKLPFAVLSVSDERVVLDARGNGLVRSFEQPVPHGSPPRYVVLDVDSADDEFVEYLLPELIASAGRGKEYVALEDLLKAVVAFWEIYGGPAKRRMIEKARNALARAFGRHFQNVFQFEATGTAGGDIIRVINSPAVFDPRGRTQSWQGLQRRASASVGRTPPRARPAPGQQVLFEDLGLGIDLGD